MIQEDYVSFEVAKLLKEKGFNGVCSTFYRPDGNIRWGYEHCHNFNISDRIDCPTTQMAMKWLREVYKECIVVQPIITDDDGSAGCLWAFTISRLLKIQYKSECAYKHYETACEAAIKYCLTNLIK